MNMAETAMNFVGFDRIEGFIEFRATMFLV